MADLKKKIYENVCCFLVLLLVMFLVYLFATLTFAKSSPLFDFGPRDDANSDVMKVRTKDPKDINLWIKRTDKFLEEFLPNDTANNRQLCDFNDLPPPSRYCMINMDHFPAGCSRKNGYGFKTETPCIFLHLNPPETDWLPDYFEKGKKLPKEAPEELLRHIDSQHSTKLRQVWVSCVGKTPLDEKNMGKIHFLPYHGFPSFFYPARINTVGYSRPIVAVQFESPTPNVEINIECRAWAKNIPKGSQGVEFKLYIDLHS